MSDSGALWPISEAARSAGFGRVAVTTTLRRRTPVAHPHPLFAGFVFVIGGPSPSFDEGRQEPGVHKMLGSGRTGDRIALHCIELYSTTMTLTASRPVDVLLIGLGSVGTAYAYLLEHVSRALGQR